VGLSVIRRGSLVHISNMITHFGGPVNSSVGSFSRYLPTPNS
jgi:hypothetical protein